MGLQRELIVYIGVDAGLAYLGDDVIRLTGFDSIEGCGLAEIFPELMCPDGRMFCGSIAAEDKGDDTVAVRQINNCGGFAYNSGRIAGVYLPG